MQDIINNLYAKILMNEGILSDDGEADEDRIIEYATFAFDALLVQINRGRFTIQQVQDFFAKSAEENSWSGFYITLATISMPTPAVYPWRKKL